MRANSGQLGRNEESATSSGDGAKNSVRENKVGVTSCKGADDIGPDPRWTLAECH